MNAIWDIITVFGLDSLLFLVVGIWTHLDMRKEQRQKDATAQRTETAH